MLKLFFDLKCKSRKKITKIKM